MDTGAWRAAVLGVTKSWTQAYRAAAHAPPNLPPPRPPHGTQQTPPCHTAGEASYVSVFLPTRDKRALIKLPPVPRWSGEPGKEGSLQLVSLVISSEAVSRWLTAVSIFRARLALVHCLSHQTTLLWMISSPAGERSPPW